MTARPHARVTDTIPVVDPRMARGGRFLVGRRRWPEFVQEARALEAVMQEKHLLLQGHRIVGTHVTSRREWQLFVVENDCPDPGQNESSGLHPEDDETPVQEG